MKVLRHRLRLLTALSLGIAGSIGWLFLNHPFALQNRLAREQAPNFSPAQLTKQQETLRPNVRVRPDHGSQTIDPQTSARIRTTLERMPLYFIENQRKLDRRVAYYVQGRDTTLYFTSKGLIFSFSGTQKSSQDDSSGQRFLRRSIANADAREQNPTERWIVNLEFIGANAGVRPRGEGKTPAVISYFQGPQQQWRVGLRSYSRLVYSNLWPGIDLIYDGTASRLKYHFLVRPGADPNHIRLGYRGAKSISINPKNELEVMTPLGGFHDETPSAYQEIRGKRVDIPVSYLLEARDGEVDPYGFRLGSYDHTKPLVLDPAILVYAGFIGGLNDDRATGIAVDGGGNAYITGETVSDAITFPVNVGPDLVSNGGIDAFVAKVNADGSQLIYAGYIGGSGTDRGKAISLEPGCLAACSAYIAGETTSNQTSFPVAGGPDLTYNGGVDAFVAKVSADGTSLDYAGYIGGNLDDRANGIAVDGLGSAYVAGETNSNQITFPVTGGPDLTYNGGVDAFVAKLSVDGKSLEFAGYIGGSLDDRANGIAVDGLGSAYVAGETNSTQTTFPVTHGPDLTHNGGVDAFVAKLSADGTSLDFAGYIGGTLDDRANAIAVDGLGSAYVAGETNSTQTTFPVTGGPDLTHNGGVDAFVAKLSADGTSLDFAGYIGGTLDDRANGIAVDDLGSAYVAGETNSTQTTFPVTGGPDLTHNGGVDAFVAKLSADGTSLDFAGYIGGSLDDRANGIAVDDLGRVYVAGETASNGITFPERTGPDLTHSGAIDAFVAQICNVCVDLALSGVSSPTATKPGQPITYTFTATNHGPDNATGVTFVDTLPAGVSFVSAVPSSGSCSGTSTVTCNLGTLANGANATVAITVTPATTGSLTNNATVSAKQPDTDLSNNAASVKTQVTLANLVAKITARPSNVAPGSTITISDETKNKESVQAEASITEFFLSTDKDLGSDTFLGSRSVPPLASKQASTGSTTVTIPLGTTPGTYYILVIADAEQLVDETKEANISSKSIKVTLPDLVVSVSGFSSAAAGSSITIKDSTKNRGAVPGAATTTKFFLSTDQVLDGTDFLLGNRAVDPLAAKQTSVGLTVVTVPLGTTAGSYFVIAVADADNTDEETNEGNNITAKKLKVTP